MELFTELRQRIASRKATRKVVDSVVDHYSHTLETPALYDARMKIANDFYAAKGTTPDQVSGREWLENLQKIQAMPEWQNPPDASSSES